MGIHGLLSQIGPGQRISLAKLSADHYAQHNRPLRLAIDISIWLFQIQSGKGGSNPALRTFYYRLLRLLTLNIWPLFVFDGPNKPLFKRNKKVGGPGVRVASVPEFLAKQLLKQFGFPWHVAPGEAEAECALLQREACVDAVLSEDVDTLMFGSGLTLRNWTSENTSKSPTHVNVYRATDTKQQSGLDREGMILVALMSGGDYLPQGVPGCGPKVACDAARAGFGRDLCALSRKDTSAIQAWKEGLMHQIRTNESKFFSRKNSTLTIPDDFPNLEVLGYYTHPCVSTPDKLARLRQELRWDQDIDFTALRSFAADAFDWRCLGGAKKFIKNLAPAMLVRELRLRANRNESLEQDAQEQAEQSLVSAILGKRNHKTTDSELEYRICYIPAQLVPIDLSIEEEDDQFIPAGGDAEGDSDAESECIAPPSTQDDETTSEAPMSPSKKRNFKPFDPAQPEKLWILKTFLQIGCPLLVEDYEASFTDPREFLKARRKAKNASKGNVSKGKKAKDKQGDIPPENTLAAYAKVTKPVNGTGRRDAMKGLTSSQANERCTSQPDRNEGRSGKDESTRTCMFQLPSTQMPTESIQQSLIEPAQSIEVLDLADETPRASQQARSLPNVNASIFTTLVQADETAKASTSRQAQDIQATPRRSKKRPSPDLCSPAASQKTITSYYSPSPRKHRSQSVLTTQNEIIDLTSSPPSKIAPSKPLTPTPPNTRFRFLRDGEERTTQPVLSPDRLPDTVTKRRRKALLKRWQTEPVLGLDGAEDHDALAIPRPASGDLSPALRLVIPNPAIIGHAETVDPVPLNLAVPPQKASTLSEQVSLRDTFDRQSFNHQRPDSVTSQVTRQSPRHLVRKTRIELRDSLEGWWKEVDAETVDLSGDGSGWKKSGGRARIPDTSAKGWRKSGLEVLDLTGA